MTTRRQVMRRRRRTLARALITLPPARPDLFSGQLRSTRATSVQRLPGPLRGAASATLADWLAARRSR